MDFDVEDEWQRECLAENGWCKKWLMARMVGGENNQWRGWLVEKMVGGEDGW